MLSLDQTAQREWLQARYHILELAALLDRLDVAAQREHRAAGDHPRVVQIREALGAVCQAGGSPERVEAVLLHYTKAVPTA